MSATVSVVLVGAGAARLLVGVGGPAGVPISPLSFPKTRSSRPVVVSRHVPDRGSCVMVILTATVMRGAAPATTLGVCLPVIAVAIIAAVVTLSVSAWATGTMPSLGTAYAIPCWGVVPTVTASVRVGFIVRRRGRVLTACWGVVGGGSGFRSGVGSGVVGPSGRDLTCGGSGLRVGLLCPVA